MNKELNVAPLSAGYMLTSLVGFLVSAFYIMPNSATWGFTLLLFFILMFVASLISMTYAPTEWPFKAKLKNKDKL
ncbi:MAG TPA: hypothetical protein VI564_08070 [Candidatus Nanoarchaeia archaeon]|nr:hypothetical protein [Candidatus Nanoarchaeia archaeon]